jgi:hypothetical protein
VEEDEHDPSKLKLNVACPYDTKTSGGLHVELRSGPRGVGAILPRWLAKTDA